VTAPRAAGHALAEAIESRLRERMHAADQPQTSPGGRAERLPDRWDPAAARGLSEPELLLYRSNLLGSDLRLTNYGGGNTSAKVPMTDPVTGDTVEVLWVKGSGGDLASLSLDGFATLYLDKLHALQAQYRGVEHEDEMAGRLAHCTFDLNPRAASIDTPLHGFIPHRHVDHMHADAIVAIAAARDGERLTRAIFGDAVRWVPWQRPGFDLGLAVGRAAAAPGTVGLVLGSHGLITWADSSRACYETTLSVVQQAADWLAAHGRPLPFGPPAVATLPEADRHALVAHVAPVLRGLVSGPVPKVMYYADPPGVLAFVNSARGGELAARGTTCPDHFLRTKIRPLVVPFDSGRETAADLTARASPLVERYREEYEAYYARCRRPDSPPMRDPNPVLVLVPGVGLLAFQSDASTARIAAEYFGNTINVMRWAEGVDVYRPLPEQAAFDVEYWALEEAKLRRLPPPRPLDGRIALVTGGAGGIGSAVARRLLADGACVMLADLDRAALDAVIGDLRAAHGPDRVAGLEGDVTDESAVRTLFERVACRFGGLDILVSNAGIASASPVDETPLVTWQRTLDVLATGYFLVAREGFALLKRQRRGGSVVFVGSKNALVASAGAAAYSTAKAAELHLARCLALEGADHGIRVNVVNPDAVIRGSRIWSGSWRAERAAANRIDEDQVEEFYRQRSLLKQSVLPEDVAEAVAFFASDRASKSTGNILNVDAGNLTAFTR
jgi:rhamnulose-1-phosphate aldolase/alcohol dehydrogenase